MPLIRRLEEQTFPARCRRRPREKSQRLYREEASTSSQLQPPFRRHAHCRLPLRTIEHMPQGDKSKYTGKQKRQAEHIEEGYEKKGVSKQEAEKRAWATVNKSTGGGKKSGSGRGKPTNQSPAKKGGRKGGKATAKKKM